jgi:helix-turn-helix protein
MQKLYQALHKLKDQDLVKQAQERVAHASRLSPARRALDICKLAADYKAGWSLRQLAEKNGICRETVTLQLRKAGVAIRLRGSNVRVYEKLSRA